MHICIVGIGNPWASDDGVGSEVVRRLQAEYGVGDQGAIKFMTLPQPGVELLDLMDHCDVLMLVDAVSSGAPPGTLHREEWRPGLLDSRGVERASSHGFGVREVLDLATALGRLPGQVILWGVEVASTEPGEGLSPAVAAAVPSVVARLRRELEGWPSASG